MTTAEWIGVSAGIVAVLTGALKFAFWVFGFSKKLIAKRRQEWIFTWDVEVLSSDSQQVAEVIAKLAVRARTLTEAGSRAQILIQQWNQNRLGFCWPMNQPLPNDDEGNSIQVFHPDLLPTKDGQQMGVTANIAKRKG